MIVRDVMKTPVISVSVDATYEEAAWLMHENRFSGLPVVDRSGKLIGVISEKDLFRALYPRYEEFSQDPVACLDQEEREGEIVDIRMSSVVDHMTPGVITIDPESPVLRAGGLMLAHGIHRLPVIEKGQLVGIVTRREIYSSILQRRLGLIPEDGLSGAKPKRVQNL